MSHRFGAPHGQEATLAEAGEAKSLSGRSVNTGTKLSGFDWNGTTIEYSPPELGDRTIWIGYDPVETDSAIAQPYRWYHHVMFSSGAFFLIGVMCMFGRSGA